MTNKTIIPRERIETIKLVRTVIARPAGSVGNIGFSPCAWTAGYGTNQERAIRAFYSINSHIADCDEGDDYDC